MTYRFVVNALTDYTTLLGNDFKKEILGFIVYFNMKHATIVFPI